MARYEPAGSGEVPMQFVLALPPPLASLDPARGRVNKQDDLQRQGEVAIVDRIVSEQFFYRCVGKTLHLVKDCSSETPRNFAVDGEDLGGRFGVRREPRFACLVVDGNLCNTPRA